MRQFAYICVNKQLSVNNMLPLFHTVLLDVTFADIFIYPIWDLICKLWWLLWHNPLAFLGFVAFCWLIHAMTKGRICGLPW